MSPTIATAVTGHLAEVFALQRIPLKIFTDNRQPFNYKEWYTFRDKYCFKHTTLSPHYPQLSNIIGRHVCNMKSTLSKAKDSIEFLGFKH